MRKYKLATGQIYHIFSRSISNFEIFRNSFHYLRILNVIRYYQRENSPMKFSDFIKLSKSKQSNFSVDALSLERKKIVKIIAYCIMPTHFHLILEQTKDKGISIFISNILNSYTRYFNTKHKRKGPLWEGRFKSVLVETDEQLIHLTRYLHLNPVTAYLVNSPEEWMHSSCREYLLKSEENDTVCEYESILDVKPDSYRQFMHDRISYQRELVKIKDLFLE